MCPIWCCLYSFIYMRNAGCLLRRRHIEVLVAGLGITCMQLGKEQKKSNKLTQSFLLLKLSEKEEKRDGWCKGNHIAFAPTRLLHTLSSFLQSWCDKVYYKQNLSNTTPLPSCSSISNPTHHSLRILSFSLHYLLATHRPSLILLLLYIDKYSR